MSAYIILGPSLQSYAPCPHQTTAYLPLTAAGHSGAAACAAYGIPGGAVSSSSGAATAAASGPHAPLGAGEVTSAGGLRSATGSGIVGGVNRTTNMRRMQMTRQINKAPVYMPFNGRDNHIEKERWRRCVRSRGSKLGFVETHFFFLRLSARSRGFAL